MRWVADDGVEAAARHDFRKDILEVHGPQFAFFLATETFSFMDASADEAVAANDVFAKRWQQGLFLEVRQLLILMGAGGGFVFEQAQVKGELADLDGLGVEVHAVDVVQEDFAFLFQ